MDKQELLRKLRQKFAEAKQPQSAENLKQLWQQWVADWVQTCQHATDDLDTLRPNVLESAQAFITNHLLEAVNKTTFQLKEGEIYQAYYSNIENLKVKITTCASLAELTALLEADGS